MFFIMHTSYEVADLWYIPLNNTVASAVTKEKEIEGIQIKKEKENYLQVQMVFSSI